MITDCLALVVDGNEDERNMYRLALEDAHLDIATASSLRDAYARFRHLRIEAVICDLDDWDRDAVYWPPLLEMIEPSAPTVGITSNPHDAKLRRHRRDFTLVLMKPVQIEFLKAQLMHLLATRPPATLHQRVHRARIYLLRARREASVLIEQSQLLITEARRRG